MSYLLVCSYSNCHGILIVHGIGVYILFFIITFWVFLVGQSEKGRVTAVPTWMYELVLHYATADLTGFH